MKPVRNNIIRHPVTGPRCVLLFSRSPLREGSAKGLPKGSELFAFARRRIAEAVRTLPGTDLVLVGDGPTLQGSRLLPQRGRGFGERLRNAFVDVWALGYGDVVAVPSDVPALGREALSAAFVALRSGPVVFGPSPDGGIYLLGLAEDPGAFFFSVRWLTPHLALDLFRRSRDAGRSLAVLSPLPDVDRHGDLLAIASDAALDPELHSLLDRLLALFARRAERARRVSLSASPGGASARAPPSRVPLAA
jgi:glycosyltransferase A (GT-A) superfamily protein (DUF2064 family)